MSTLVINRFDSRCESCGKGAAWEEKSHNTLLGYSVKPGENGCGATWTHVRSDYLGLDERISEMRPDLKLIPMPEFK